MRKLTHEEILDRQKGRQEKSSLPFCVVLNDIRSLYNVGSIFRTADGAGLRKIWICGITGHPPNNQISKTALGAQDAMDWEYRESVVDLAKELKDQGYQIVLLEQIEGSVPYEEFVPQKPVCLIIGNEIEGINENLVKISDVAVEIDMAGLKNSLNVSVAFGVVAYQFRQQLKRVGIE